MISPISFLRTVATLAGFVAASACLAGATRNTQNVFLITTDGLRWQEVFTGAEELLLNKANGGVNDVDALKRDFWRATPEERRKALLPFMWSEIATKGQIYGNRAKGSDAHIVNTKRFSYPGYSEFLTGVADERIISNDKVPNPNTNVLEWLNQRPAFAGKVAAIVNWDVIPWILNTERSRLPVWTGFPLQPNAPVLIHVSPELEKMVADTTVLWPGMVMDSITFHAALDYVKSAQPRAFYVSFVETDEWPHEGRYDLALRSAHNVDRFIQRLWQTVQSLPAYRDKTTLVITTDHGRGDGPKNWQRHGVGVEGAENIWIAVIGPDTPPLGERVNCAPVTQSRVAATIAALLGEDYHGAFPKTGAPIWEAIATGGK